MAEVLEAMGFPSEWCERALSSSSGLETAVDLLLQWQAHGVPQPPPPPSGLSFPAGVMPQQDDANSLPAAPTLRLVPLPAAAHAAKASPAGERERSPSPSSCLDGPSRAAGDPGPSAALVCPATDVATSSNGGGGLVERSAATEASAVEGAAHASKIGGRSAPVDILNGTDAVVPDAYAEERKARYLAARRAKQEKEEEKARIRQHMEEDMKLRRFRRSYRSLPESTAGNSSAATDVGESPSNSSQPRAMSMDSAVELQIRCPGNHVMKASFTAGTRLKEVRAHVERELQAPHQETSPRDRPSCTRPTSVPFTGQSIRLSTDRQAERELLRMARENFEIQTNRIFASAKMLRGTVEEPQASTGQRKDIIYFLIPFPRREFFTESAMDSTLADAQLVPRGTLVVQPIAIEEHQARRIHPQPESFLARRDEERISEIIAPRVGGFQTAEAIPSARDEGVSSPVLDGEADIAFAIWGGQSHREQSAIETAKSGRTLEMEGERVRLRECALQAAAKRMTEAAKLFHAGLPLVEGETGEAFHFPREAENQKPLNEDSVPSPQPAAQMNAFASLADDNLSVNDNASGAGARPLCAQIRTEVHSPGASEPERQLDALHNRVRAAAERRNRSSHPEADRALSNSGGSTRDPEGVDTSRFGQDESESHPVRYRARIPQSSRLLSRPEKVQRTSMMSPASSSSIPHEALNNEDQQIGGRSDRQPARLSIGGPRRAGPLEAALQRCKAAVEVHNKGKAIVQEPVRPTHIVSVPSSSHHAENRRTTSSLRVRLEDGSVQLHTFASDTTLRLVREAIVPQGAAASDYGIVVPFPEPHFVEGEDLDGTLEAVGLVPGGTIHLRKVGTSGVVRQGRTLPRRRRFLEDSDDDEFDTVEGMFRHLTERIHDRPDLTYEELMELEESIGRVHVGVPEEVITTLPTHIVKARATADGQAEREAEEPDLCIVCMSEMADGEEALSLPCVHTFHTICIRQWLQQSTCCPTCKQTLV